ncbi:outer membrane lipoprotein-sorting protein [Candidatus Bipolaricaulota bacterium]|nr:outer membrane lipoprotein-sorting protein [Candidatus Bipolaricaulota bacterium]
MRSMRKTGIALIMILGLMSSAFAGGREEASANDAADDAPEFEAYSGTDGLTAQEIMTEADTSLMPNDVRADVTMTLVNRNGSRRVREISFVSKEVNGLNKMVMHFRAPADVEGTGFLLIESDSGETDMWLYLPDLNRVRRIVSSSRTDSFMGSDLSYSDMENTQLDDYRFVRFQDDSVDGEACYVVQATPVSETVANDTGYGRIIYFISTEKLIPIQAVFFDLSGTYFKRMHVHAVEAIGDTWVPIRVEVENLGQEHRTIMELRNVRVETNPDDSLFTQQYLQRGN